MKSFGSFVGLVLMAYLGVIVAFLMTGCDEGSTVSGPGDQTRATPIAASDWVSFVDWSQAVTVELNMVEGAGGGYAFQPSNLSFEAGRPYILRINNPATNAEKHYFATEGLGDFYQAIATRKIETADAEYKAPYFEAVELLIGGNLDLYFVPVVAGTYDVLCTIPGHKEGGMLGTVQITGGAGYQLDLEVASDFEFSLTQDSRKSGSHPVWSSAEEMPVVTSETPYSFQPPEMSLTQDTAYRITVSNPSGNSSKHYFTAPEFYRSVVIRKAQDSQAEIKPLYLNAVEVLVGGSTEMFMVPTTAGTFESLCTIPGHADLGMKGSVVVGP